MSDGTILRTFTPRGGQVTTRDKQGRRNERRARMTSYPIRFFRSLEGKTSCDRKRHFVVPQVVGLFTTHVATIASSSTFSPVLRRARPRLRVNAYRGFFQTGGLPSRGNTLILGPESAALTATRSERRHRYSMIST